MRTLAAFALFLGLAAGQEPAAGTPEFSRPGGAFAKPFWLSLTAKPPTAVVRYTRDGSEPEEGSPACTGRIRIRNTTQVRARVFEEGRAPGPIVTHVYFALARDLHDFRSNLPIILVDTFGFDFNTEAKPGEPRPYRPVSVAFIDGDAKITDPPVFAGRAAMHVRGQSTTGYAKKQYALEIRGEDDADRDVPLLDLPAESDWILHGPYSDKTLMRNYLMYAWSNRIGRYAARCRFVEVFLNRDDGKFRWLGGASLSDTDYLGVYVFMEKIKRGKDRVDAEYIVKRDWESGAGRSRKFTTATYRDRLAYVYPSPARITSEQKRRIRGIFNAFEKALSDPDMGYAKHIDVDSWIDHHILCEMGRSVDAFVLSTYMYRERGGKICMGPIWDFNGALGNADYFEAWKTEGWHHRNPEFPADNGNGYRTYARIFEDPAFRRRYAKRWAGLRRGPLRTEALLADIDRTAALLDEARKRNFTRWMVLGREVWPNRRVFDTYEEEVAYLKDWLAKRLAWMDGAID
ncbi:MAG: CotH kinase family protein [Planctomycetota bacterium]|jgi:hypothetical protein